MSFKSFTCFTYKKYFLKCFVCSLCCLFTSERLNKVSRLKIRANIVVARAPQSPALSSAYVYKCICGRSSSLFIVHSSRSICNLFSVCMEKIRVSTFWGILFIPMLTWSFNLDASCYCFTRRFFSLLLPLLSFHLFRLFCILWFLNIRFTYLFNYRSCVQERDGTFLSFTRTHLHTCILWDRSVHFRIKFLIELFEYATK